jgi:hypothetical protein
MLELNILLLEISIILGVNILIFIFSLVSTDLLVSSLSFLIFLILLIPFYTLIEKLESTVFANNLEGLPFFRLLFFYSWLLNIFIGIGLFVELIYLFMFC